MTEKLESKLRQAIELVGREEESIIKEDINKCLAMIELVFKDAGWINKEHLDATLYAMSKGKDLDHELRLAREVARCWLRENVDDNGASTATLDPTRISQEWFNRSGII